MQKVQKVYFSDVSSAPLPRNFMVQVKTLFNNSNIFTENFYMHLAQPCLPNNQYVCFLSAKIWLIFLIGQVRKDTRKTNLQIIH